MSSSCPPSRIVQTTYGPIRGIRLLSEGDRSVDAFLGIPYAQPPVGPLRFKKPQPHKGWKEIRECREFGNQPYQKAERKEGEPPFGEDCLVLNVFSPGWEPPDEGFAVMVYIHGGGFLNGTSVNLGDRNICQFLCLKDVIVVTIQYRVGYLGLWTTGDDVCRGNQCLWDQTFALKWINQNIKNFNGNPDNVTIFGQSSGGSSVDILSLSPHSWNLFQKFIAMGGNAGCQRSFSRRNLQFCRELADALGLENIKDSEKLLDELRKVPADKFIPLSVFEVPRGDCTIGIHIDGEFLPRSIEELRMIAPPKPRIYGQTRCEFLGYILKSHTFEEVEKTARRLFPERDYPRNYQALRQEYAQRVRSLMRSGDVNSLKKAISDARGDPFQTIGTQKSALESVENGNEAVYIYRMDHFNKDTKGWFHDGGIGDAAHGTDLSYVFGRPMSALSFDFDHDDRKMVDLMTTMWTNFAKYGDPNFRGASSFRWLPASKENPQHHLQIGLSPKMNSLFFDGRPLWYIHQSRKYKLG